MSFDVGSVIAKVDADISGFKKGMAEAKSEASGIGSHLKDIGSGIKDFADKAAVVSAVATAAIVAFGKASVDSFNQSADVIKQQEAVLKSTGNAAGVTTEQLQKYASQLQKVTRFSDEAVMQGQNLLLTFTAIKGPTLKQATDIILDMSTALGQDLKSSAIQVGKALQDPILGVTALRRVGVNFNKEAQDTIKALVDTGHAAEAQQFILKELNTEFGGSATAAAQTFGGQIDILKNKFDDFKEKIGGVLAAIAQFAITGDTGGVKSALSALIPDQKSVETILSIITGLRDAFISFGKWVAENKELVTTFLTGLAIGIGAILIVAPLVAAVMNPFVLIFGAIALAIAALYTAWQTNFLGIQDITNQVITAIKWFLDNILMPAFQAFSNWFSKVLAPAIVAVWQGFLMPLFQAFVGWFKERWEFIKTMIDGVWKIITGIVQVAWALVSGIITVGLQILSGNWSGAWETIKQKTHDVWEGLKNIFNGAIDFIKGWGGMVLHELVKPFEDAWNRIQEFVQKIKDKLDFTKRQSPSVLDVVRNGVNKVNEALGDLAYGGVFTANAAGAAVSYGGNQNQTTVVKVDMAGAVIADAFGAAQMGEILGDGIIKRLQQNVRL